jgi:TrmH family RNA methyltransferase
VSHARRLLRPAVRRTERRFLLEGPQAVSAAAAAGLLLEVYATEQAAAGLRLEVPVTIVGDRALATLTDTVTPQGLVGVAGTLDVPLTRALAGAPQLVVVLHDVRDPGNAGTIIRTADAAGADAVLLTGDAVDVHNGKCVRASAGSIFHVPIAAAPWPEALAALHARGLQVLATSGAGERELDELDLTGPVAWVLGNEARGLDGAVLASADAAVRIPLHGRAESLNVASAAAVCLYAAARQQRAARTEV